MSRRSFLTGRIQSAGYWNRQLLSDVSGEHGHDLFQYAPDAALIATDPAILAALTELIGPAELDQCMHVHYNDNPKPGDWHIDDYCGQPWPNNQRHAIVCYFPQDTPPEMGPTAVRVNGVEHVAAGPAGTFIAMRHDVEHRATANTTGRQRVMLKFLFRSVR